MSIAAEIRKHPTINDKELAIHLGIDVSYIREVRSRDKNPEKRKAYWRMKSYERHPRQPTLAEKRGPEFDAYIKAHYNIDQTAAKIGRHLGVTSNVVVGRANRLGLSKPKRSTASQ